MSLLYKIPGLNELVESKWFWPALQGIAAAIVLGLGYFGYTAYQRSVQEKAHHSLVDALTYFDATVSDEPDEDAEMTFATEQEKWQKVAGVFKDGYARNSSAGIAPLFSAYEAQAHINLGDKVTAEKLLSESVPHIPNDALRSYFQVKLALLRLDSKSPALQTQGEQLLQEVANAEALAAHPMALYELGQWHFIKNDFVQAKNYLEQLDLKYGKSTEQPSEWADKGKKLLKLISV